MKTVWGSSLIQRQSRPYWKRSPRLLMMWLAGVVERKERAQRELTLYFQNKKKTIIIRRHLTMCFLGFNRDKKNVTSILLRRQMRMSCVICHNHLGNRLLIRSLSKVVNSSMLQCQESRTENLWRISSIDSDRSQELATKLIEKVYKTFRSVLRIKISSINQ